MSNNVVIIPIKLNSQTQIFTPISIVRVGPRTYHVANFDGDRFDDTGHGCDDHGAQVECLLDGHVLEELGIVLLQHSHCELHTT
jgi:hypothetical protein